MSDDKRCCPTDAKPATCHYTPEGDDLYIVGPLDAKAGVLLISDIFGMLANSKRFADELAKAGFVVVMPDFFGEGAWLEQNFPPKSYEDPEWQAFYQYITDIKLHSDRSKRAIAVLKKLGAQKIGAVGMCWGGRIAVDLSASNSVDAVASPHPSFMTPEIISTVRTPICLLPSIEETNYEEVERAFQALPVEPKPYKHYQTLHHGFLGSRFDPDEATDVERADCEEAKNTIINFFKQTLN